MKIRLFSIRFIDLSLQSSTGFKDTPQIRGWVVSDLSSGNIKYSNVIYQNLPKRHTKCVAEPDF